MTPDKITVIIAGLFGITFIYWFFLMKKGKEVAVENEQSLRSGELEVDVVVEGGYSPDIISIPKGRATKINFVRKDRSSCLEEIVLPDFKVKKFLPVGEKVTVEITPEKIGEFGFACGMNMFHGKIVVK